MLLVGRIIYWLQVQLGHYQMVVTRYISPPVTTDVKK